MKRYFKFYTTLAIFLLCGCISTSPNRTVMKKGQMDAMIASVYQYIGTPYVYGGDDKSGLDCSGLAVRIYKDQFNMDIPHNTLALYKTGRPISMRELQSGDIVFFRSDNRRFPSHMGIYTGKYKFVHASASRGVVESSLISDYYRKHYIGARRYIRVRK